MTSLAALPTEGVSDRTAMIDRVSIADALSMINREDQTVPAVVAGALPAIAEAVAAAESALRAGGRLIYLGAGTSGRLGVLDASECPPTFGADPGQVVGIIAGGDHALRHPVEGAEDSPEQGAADLAALSAGATDCVIGIAASGRTPYVIGALTHARKAGARTVALACVKGSRIGAAADIAIEVETGPEALSGSTRMKAGTAQKLVLNMISTVTMIRLGKAWGNLMVDVVASNEKLRDRARRILMRVCEIDPETADATLAAAGGSVKLAIFMQKSGLDAETAGIALEESGGRLAEALAVL